jgi:hypothetical protein
MLDAAKAEVDAFTLACNQYLIPQLVEDHFGPDAPECRLFCHSVSEALKGKMQSIVVTILQNDKLGTFSQQVAFRDLLDFLNIPFTSGPVLPIPQVPEEDGEDGDGGQPDDGGDKGQ